MLYSGRVFKFFVICEKIFDRVFGTTTVPLIKKQSVY